MTAKQKGNGADAPETTDAKAVAARGAKGSVHEAIGKLIGDDEALAQGGAEKRAVAKAKPKTSSRS